MPTKLFSELGLSEPLLKAIDQLGFEQAAPIQAEAIPLLMQGRDIVGQSQTGSGKTAAFGIPAVEMVEVGRRAVQVLVLCPTRELAVQVSEDLHQLALFKRGVHVLPIYGGQSYERQFDGLNRGAQIVIGTPGRVMDHLRRGTLRLEAVRLVVLDEADVMLNMGFREDIEVILQSVPKERQTVFFSATIPRPIRDLIDRFAREPQSVQIEQKALTVPTVEQVYYEVDRRFKLELLTRLIDIHDLKLGIIFCNTKRMVDELADHLEAQGYLADRLHGDMSQNHRDRVMNKFRRSGLEFLVATDVAARGIDVDDVQVVFNYDLPYDGEDYVHRIGRTGRAGRSGRAISFVSGREMFQIRAIERFTNTRIHRARVPTQAEVDEAREMVFVSRLREVLAEGEFRRQEPLVERLLEEGFSSTDIACACLAQLQGLEAPPARQAPARPEPPQDRPGRERWIGGARGRAEDRGGWKGERRSSPPGPADSGARAKAPARRESVGPVPDRAPHASPSAAAPPPPPSEPGTEVGPGIESRPKPESAPPPAAQAPSAVPVAGVSDLLEKGVRDADGEEKAGGMRAASPTPSASMGRGAQAAVGEPGPARAIEPRGATPPTRLAGDAGRRKEKAAGPERPLDAGPRAHQVVPPRPGPAESGRKSMPPWLRRGVPGEKAASSTKGKRSREGSFTRLHLNLGEAMGVGPADVVGAIAGETGLPAEVVGAIDVRERHLFVDVAEEHANAVLSKLNRTRIKGCRLKAKIA